MTKKLGLQLNTFTTVAGLTLLVYPLSYSALHFLCKSSVNLLAPLAMVVSLLGGIILATKIFLSVPAKFLTPFFTPFLAGLSFACFYYFKISTFIYDATTPTGLTGMVEQIARDHFPASFMAFPEVPANYHQGYVILASFFKIVLGISAYSALQIMLIAGAFYFVFWSSLLLKASFRSICIFVAGLILVASFPIFPDWFNFKNAISYMEYVTWGDLILSSSFAWGMPALILLLIKLDDAKQGWNKYLTLATLLILISLYNATIYSVGLFLFLLDAVVYFYNDYQKEKRMNKKLQSQFATALLLTLIIPKFLPTVFLMGPSFVSATVSLSYYNKDFQKDFLEYLRLTGAVLILAVFLIKSRFFKETQKHFYWGVLFCALFPVVFFIRDIGPWDNLHKFAGLTQFFCILLVSSLSSHIAWKRPLWIFLSLTVVGTSSLAVIDNFKHRTSFRFLKFREYPSNETLFFRSLANEALLYGYGDNFYEHAYVANDAGVFLRTSYYPVFMLNNEIESEYFYIKDWYNHPSKSQEVVEKRLARPDSFILIENLQLDEFKKKLAGLKSPPLFKRQFEKWSLISQRSYGSDWSPLN